jgi:biopolymer transport protein ExbB
MTMSTRLRAAACGLALCLVLLIPGCARVQAPPAAEAASPAAGQVEEGAATRSESFLHWMYRASGPIGLLILGMSIYLVAVVVWMAYHYRRSVALPEPLVRDLTELLAQKRFADAYQRAAADPSFLGRTLASGVRKLPAGIPAAQRAMEMVNDDITMEMEHRTTYLATVGTLGPMIGLVGTVYGMILSFRVMATEGGSPQASLLAAGISTALFATLEGIALAVPAIACYAFFRNRIARLSLEVEIAAESFLEQFAPGVRPPHPLVTTAGQQRTALGPPGVSP